MIYDAFQQKSIDYIKNDFSVLVSAPTGAGKTAIAEYVIHDCLLKDTHVIYTAPLKALSNQKFRDFQETFPGKIGILTGDVSINPQAPVLIMTTEIFRNKILDDPESLKHYSWVIFDEIHYLDNYERGSVWEESLIFLPTHMKILGLSATIPNIDEFAAWIQSIHPKPLKVVKEDKRPVPLHFYYQCQGLIVDNINKVNALAYQSAGPRRDRYGRHSRDDHLKPNKPTSIIRHLQEEERLPCIYFVFNRRRTEYLAQEINSFSFLTPEERFTIANMYAALCKRFDLEKEKSALFLKPYIERGIAYHHAGMLPTLKEVVERLFTSRLIKVIFTTETFALGINMPARTVVFDELRKFYGIAFADLKTRDFYQMAGRAGRRGIDPEGFVYSRVNPNYTQFSELKRMIYGTPERVQSRFNASYATLLNLYSNYGEELYDIYPRSFHYFQEKKERQKALDLLRAKVAILKDMGYIQHQAVTPKGSFASKMYGYELPLAELYEQGIFEDLSENELAILCSALVFEPRKKSVMPPITKRAKALRSRTDDVVRKIQRNETKFKITPLSKTYEYHLSPCIEAWTRGQTFDSVLQYTDADEGEVIRYFRMTVQVLRELLGTPATDEFKEKIYRVMKNIDRDQIDAEKQLRG